MAGGIYLLRGDDDFLPMTEAPYDSEDVLQALIAKYPSLLAGRSATGCGAAPLVVDSPGSRAGI